MLLMNSMSDLAKLLGWKLSNLPVDFTCLQRGHFVDFFHPFTALDSRVCKECNNFEYD